MQIRKCNVIYEMWQFQCEKCNVTSTIWQIQFEKYDKTYAIWQAVAEVVPAPVHFKLKLDLVR